MRTLCVRGKDTARSGRGVLFTHRMIPCPDGTGRPVWPGMRIILKSYEIYCMVMSARASSLIRLPDGTPGLVGRTPQAR